MATHHNIRFEELGIFKVRGSWGWGRGTQKSSELQNKKCDRVLKSRELICVWKDFILNTWTKEITFQRGVSSLHVCLDSQQPPRTQSSPALAPGVSREGMKRKQLEMETRIWMRFVAKAKHSVPTDLNFLCLFPGLGSLLKLTPLPSLLLPDSPMEWRGFREVKVKRGTIWRPLIVFSLAVPRGDSRKWNCSFGPTSLSDILFIKAWHLDLLSCGMLSVAVPSHLGTLVFQTYLCVVLSAELLPSCFSSDEPVQVIRENGWSMARFSPSQCHPSTVARTQVGSLFANRRDVLAWKSAPYGRKSQLCFQEARQQPAFVCNCLLRFLPLLVVASCSCIQFTWDIS